MDILKPPMSCSRMLWSPIPKIPRPVIFWRAFSAAEEVTRVGTLPSGMPQKATHEFVLSYDGLLERGLRSTKPGATLIESLHQVELQSSEQPASLRTLYSLLLRPVEPILAGAELIIVVPHGILHSAPIHALRDLDGTYLIERSAVQYAPSVAVAFECARVSDKMEQETAVLVAADRTPYSDLAELPGATDEVKQIETWFSRATVLSGA
jgi:hypothetical protein